MAKQPPVPYDLDEALGLLAGVKHWTIQTLNRNGERTGYQCTIWSNGRRVTASSVYTPLTAVKAAFEKLNPPKFKVVK